MDLLEKYKPSNFNEIVGNEKIYKKLLDDITKNKYKGKYLLVGESGTGKTSFANILSKTKKSKIIEIPIENISNTNNENIKISSIFKKSLFPRIILIDNIKFTNSNSNSSYETKLKKLFDIINTDTHNLIILISNENKTSLFKKIKDLKTFNFKKLTDNDIQKRIDYIIEKEEIDNTAKTTKTFLKKLYQNNEYDLRRIITNLGVLVLSEKGKKSIKFTSKNKLLINQNTVDSNTFKNSYDLLNTAFATDMHKKSIDECESMYFNDTFIIPNSSFEYYLNGKSKDLDDIIQSLDGMSSSDIIYNTNPTDFSLQPYYANLEYTNVVKSMGKIKARMFFPSCVSKANKNKNNNNKISNLKMSSGLSCFSNMDFELINQLALHNKKNKKEKITEDDTLIKKIFTIQNNLPKQAPPIIEKKEKPKKKKTPKKDKKEIPIIEEDKPKKKIIIKKKKKDVDKILPKKKINIKKNKEIKE